ncbi:MAG: nucleotide exchange factor GrpE [Acidimicrobiia bacterium]
MTDQQPDIVDAEIMEVTGVESHGTRLELPEDKDEAIEFLRSELETAQAEATSYLDDLRRVAADFDNYRKRTNREQAMITDRAAERVVRELMPVLDSFDAALNATPATDAERSLLSGMINTREQLLTALEREGLQVVPSIGEPFDPEIHEPVGAPAGKTDLVVSDELRRGYKLRDRVLRPAMVMLEERQ